eukprot:gene11894-13127_t
MAANSDFDEWLSAKLKSLQLDVEIFIDYIKGVLEEDVSEEEKTDTISNILEGALEEPSSSSLECEAILKKWNEVSCKEETAETPANNGIAASADDMIRDIIHKQQSTFSSMKPSTGTSGDDEYKRRVLQQYSHIEEEVDSLDYLIALFQNMNAKSVVEQQKIEREKQKKASEDKKEKDKMNREVEKVKKQERQEREKKRTQKGERKTR